MEKRPSEEPLKHSDQDEQMADIQIKVCLNEKQKVVEGKAAPPRDDGALAIAACVRDNQASEMIWQSTSESNEKGEGFQSCLKAAACKDRKNSNGMCKGRISLHRMLKARRRKKTRVHENMGWSRRKNKMKKLKLRQRASKLHKKCADIRGRRKQ